MDKDEWFKQADYDMDTAEFMFGGERYFYSVFMCHLSIEKALKGTTTEESDIDILIISEEFEHGTSLVVEYAKRGKVMYAA